MTVAHLIPKRFADPRRGIIGSGSRPVSVTLTVILAFSCAVAPAGAQTSSQRDRTECGFLCKLGNDFKTFGTSRRTALVLGPALGVTVLSKRIDTEVSESRINSELYPGTAMDRLLEPGEIAGGSAVQFGAAFATLAVGKFSRKNTVADVGSALVRVQILNGVVTSAMKYSIRRARPDSPSRTSFPSGHTSGSFASATILQRRFGWKAGLPAYTFATLVGASRLSENRHYLSDVVFGAAVGIASGLSVSLDGRNLHVEVAPQFTHGGVGVQVRFSLANDPRPAPGNVGRR